MLKSKESTLIYNLYFLFKITTDEPINRMKLLYPLNYLAIVLIFLCSSCVGTKKFKSLQAEKSKLEKTLLGTKQELSEAKRELNKLKDASSYTREEQTEVIKNLRQQLEENQAALGAAQAATVSSQNQLQQSKQQLTSLQKQYQKQMGPFQKVQKNLQQQNKALRTIEQDIKTLLAAAPEMKLITGLDKDELVLTFDHKYLFSSSSRSLSSTGRNSLYQLAEILKRYPSIYIDINGHTPKGGDIKENWKNSTRKTLSILYTLMYQEILPDRIRVIGYGEHRPLTTEDTPEAKNQNSRTEIILHYQNTQLLKLVPIR